MLDLNDCLLLVPSQQTPVCVVRIGSPGFVIRYTRPSLPRRHPAVAQADRRSRSPRRGPLGDSTVHLHPTNVRHSLAGAMPSGSTSLQSARVDRCPDTRQLHARHPSRLRSDRGRSRLTILGTLDNPEHKRLWRPLPKAQLCTHLSSSSDALSPFPSSHPPVQSPLWRVREHFQTLAQALPPLRSPFAQISVQHQ
ncbi:hypothetical protein BD413DRAFT_65197 [Trametes elegans]|nr:hypothetical protein BD413DRAFT_65197 [Trametes elegans]